MKTLVASVVIVLAMLSTGGAEQACRPDGRLDMGGLIGTAVGAMIGSTIGDGRGQTLATGVGAVVGGLIGESLSPGRRATTPKHALVRQMQERRDQLIDAAVTGRIPIPRKAAPVRRRQQTLTHCQEIPPGTFACQDANGDWRILR